MIIQNNKSGTVLKSTRKNRIFLREYFIYIFKTSIENNMMLGQKIKKLRELKNLTQEHMAQQLGITQSAYSKIENNEVEVAYSKLEQIAKVLELRPEDIITFNEHVVFNVMHNQTGNGMVVHQASLIEKQLYEDHIKQLKEENAYLKSVLDKILLTEKKK